MFREKCPCCGFPTLDERGSFEICELCNWEDDGQDDPYADEVFGGPNGDYSLSEARKNFKENLIMYRERRSILGQTEKEIETKKSLIIAFDELENCEVNSLDFKLLWEKIKTYELVLHEIVNVKVTKYSDNIEINEDIFKLINSDDTKIVVDGLLALALNADDPDFIQDIMVFYSENKNENIRGIAILCFGHLARIHKKINKDLVLPIISDGLKDKSSFVRGHSQSALDDINIFVK